MKSIAAVLVVLSCVSQTIADGCFHNHCVHNKAVVHQKFVEVVPAAITFVPSQVLLNSQVTLYQPNDAASGIGYSYQGQAIVAQNQTQNVSNIEQRLNALEQKIDGVLSAIGGEQVTAQANKGGQPANKVNATAKGDAKWRSILQEHCVKCHGITPVDNKFAMLTQDGAFKDKLPRYSIYSRMTLPKADPLHMPRGADPLSQADLDTVRAWLHDGLQDVEY